MPKVYSSKYDRKIAAFRKWFCGKRNEESITLDMLSRQMGITKQSLSNKTRVKGSDQSVITYKDLLIFFDAVGATDQEILHYMRIGERRERSEE